MSIIPISAADYQISYIVTMFKCISWPFYIFIQKLVIRALMAFQQFDFLTGPATQLANVFSIHCSTPQDF